VRQYRYTISYYDRRGRRLDSSAVDPDWSGALEAARFAAVRRGLLAPGASARGSVEPIWDEPGRGPVVAAFRASVQIPADDGAEVEDFACTIPRDYVRGYAENGANALVARGLLAQGEVYQFLVSAYPAASATSVSAAALDGGTLSVTELDIEFEVAERPVAPLLAGSMPCGSASDDEALIPVFVPQAVTAKALEACRAAKTVETGGVLIGHLRRAGPGPDVSVEVTAQIPVMPGAGTSGNLDFTPSTWTRVSSVIDLRCRGEIPVGWWHFHPHWCRTCPAEKQAVCRLATDFFSAQDVVLHGNCFPKAFQVGLLFTERAGGMSAAMFGWHQGVIVARPFHVLAGNAESAAGGQATATEGCGPSTPRQSQLLPRARAPKRAKQEARS